MPKIRKPWVSWEEFEKIQAGTWTPAAHTHLKSHITDTPWSWTDVSKVGSNLTDLATRQHAGLTDVTSDQHHAQSHTLASHSSKAHSELSDAPADAHHPQLHASAHEVGGGDLLAFSDITGFGDYLDQAVKQASNVQFNSVQATIFMAYGTVATPDPLYRLKPYGVSDESFVRWLDKDGGDEWSIGTQSHQAGFVIRRESGTPANLVVVQRATGVVNIGVNLDTPKLTINGGFYIDTLAANNRVDDSDKWGGNAFADYMNQAVKTTSDVEFGSTQAPIFMAYGLVASPDALYRLKPYGTADESFVKYLDNTGSEEWSVGTLSHQASWVVRRESGTPANMLLVDRATGKVTAAVELDTPKLTIGSYYLDSLIANNKVPDSDKIDGIHGTDFVRGDGVDNGVVGINVVDADFKVFDSSDGSPTEYIFRDHSAGYLYLGTAGALPKFRADVRMDGNKLYFTSYYLDALSANNKVLDSNKLNGQLGSYYAVAGTKLDDWGVPDDNTDLNATTTAHGLLMKLGGGTTNFLRADGAWAAPTPAGHAASHEVGGGDLVSHDDLTDFVGDEHIDWTGASQALLTSGGIQTPIFMAYGIVATPAPLYRLKPYGTSDASFVRWLDTGGLSRWSIGTESHQGSLVIRRESGTPGNVVVVEPGGRVLIPTEVDTGKLTIGSYYLNSLIANNKVPDSDKLDGEHGSYYAVAGGAPASHATSHEVGGADLVSHDDLTDFVGAEHLSLPNSMANVINSGHDKALHDALNIDADTLDAQHGSYYRDADNLNAGIVLSARLSKTQAFYETDPRLPVTNEVHSTLSAPTIAELSIPSSPYVRNNLQFIVPIIHEYTLNGVDWFATSYTATQLKKWVAGRSMGANLFIPTPNQGEWEAVRFTFQAPTYNYMNWLYLYISNGGHQMNFKIEKSYGAETDNWSTVAQTSNSGGWPNHKSIPHTNIPWHSTGGTPGTHSKYIRLTIYPVYNPSYPDNGITLYNINWYGYYPANPQTDIWYWDENGDFYIKENLNIGDIIAGAADYDKFLVSDGGLVKYRTGTQVLSDIGASGIGHTHIKADITDTPWAWADVSKTGSNLTDLATRQHAGLTNVTSGQHHAQLHATQHHVGGGDLVDHDNLTNYVANEHIDWTGASQTLLTSGGIQTSIFMAYGIVASPDALYRLKPYGVSDESFVRWLDTGGLSRWSIGTQSHQGSFVIRRESGTPANLLVVDPATGSILAGVDIDTPKLTIGSFYLNSLIANNKVPDSDKLDGEHGSYYAVAGGAPASHATSHEVGGADLVSHDDLTDFVAGEHVSLPNTIANVLSNHNVAIHNALDITELGTVSSGVWQGTAIGWTYISKTGSNLTDLATRQHAGLTDVTSDQHHTQSHTLASHSTKAHSELSDAPADAHHAQLHASAHNSAGADELNHDNLAGFVAGEHFLQSAITTVGTIGTGVWQGTPIANAYVAGINQNLLTTSNVEFLMVTAPVLRSVGLVAYPNAVVRLYPYGVSDSSYVKWFDSASGEEWSVGTVSHQASWVVRRESGTPGNMLLVDRATGKVTAAIELDTPKLTIGSYYIDTLIANNKVDDSAKLGGTVASSYALITRALDTFGATTDITALNATTTAHGLLMKLGGGTTNFLRADGAWAAPTPAGHAASHEVGGGDLVSHDDLTDFVGDEHIDWTGASQALLTSGGIQTWAFMAYGTVGNPDPVYRLKPYGTSDDSFVRWLDTGGLSRWSVGTQSHQGSLVIRRESGTPGNVVVVEPGGRVLIPTEVDTGKLTIGSYYLNSLIANNKVPDSNRLNGQLASYYSIDGHTHVKADITNTPWAWSDVSKSGSNLSDIATRPHSQLSDAPENAHHSKLHASTHSLGQPDVVNHDNLAGFVSAEHLSLPNTIANVLSDHTKAVHDALDITELGTVSSGVWQGTAIANAYVAGINQNLLTSSSPTFDNVLISSGDGDGIKFWASDSYKIYMRQDYATEYYASDYNMYFTMTSGTNRGFVFMSGTTPNFQIDAAGNIWANNNAVIDGDLTVTGASTNFRNAIKAVDGSGSLIDADKVDNIHGADFLRKNASVALTANWDAGSYQIRALKFQSDQVTGTAPFIVASTTKVTNLNADLLEGYHASSAAGNNTIVLRTASGYIYCNYLNCTSGVTTNNPTHYFVETGDDSFLRQMTPANFVAQLVLDGLMPKSGGIFTAVVEAADHGPAAADQVVNVCYGTSTPPAANTTTIGTLFVKYT